MKDRLGVQNRLPFGTVTDAREEVEGLIRRCGHDGLVLMLSKVTQPDLAHREHHRLLPRRARPYIVAPVASTNRITAAVLRCLMIRIGHCQAVCAAGDFETNLAKVVRGLERAKRERVEILSFPEAFLCGYFDREEPTRRSAFAVDSAKMRKVLRRISRFDTTVIVGFQERRGGDLYNSALVARSGRLLGVYSKSTAYMAFHRQGREFPVFDHDGVKFGVVICSDGGYVEPTRILALKGARIIFAPHYNYIGKEGLIGHFMKVRADHAARAVENDVWFVRSNQVTIGQDKGLRYEGVGYGESYIMDPHGEILIRSRRHQEDFIFADVDPKVTDRNWKLGRSRWSAREFGKLLIDAASK